MSDTTTTTRILRDDQREQYRRDGFIVVPDVLSQDELDHFSPLLRTALGERAGADTRAFEEKSRYEQMFQQCMNLWEDYPEMRPFTFHQRMGQVAAELMEVPIARIWHDQALTKPAGGRPTDAHQDHPYWPILETNSVTAWVPMQGSTIAGGALGYLPGTHAIGLRKFVNIFFGEPQNLLADPEVAGIEPVFVEVPRGGVAFHHGLVVHLSKPNITDSPREVHTIIYFPDGSTRGYPNPHFAVERGGIEVGQAIRSDVTPIAYPIADEQWPEAPGVPMVLPGGFSRSGAGPKAKV